MICSFPSLAIHSVLEGLILKECIIDVVLDLCVFDLKKNKLLFWIIVDLYEDA